VFDDLPFPVLLNCWKHHQLFIQSKINEIACNRDFMMQNLYKILQPVGNSQLDMYTGNLFPAEIGNFIKSELDILGINNRLLYLEWLKREGNDYQIIRIYDSSEWALRAGTMNERYVHIHPAKYSPNTVRLRSNTLKTAFAILIWQRRNQTKECNLNIVNSIRINYLKLSPIKKMPDDEGIMALINFLS
jgi:hypothetical protein